jgi:type II secretory pathway component GspD/PulD (secretin)
VVTNFAFQENPTNKGNNSIVAQSAQVETGPVLDVIPRVLADGHTINLTVIPSFTEFLGYDHPPRGPKGVGANTAQPPPVLPKFSLRQTTANLNVWDGQTVIIGGMVETHTNIVRTSVLGLGRIPGLGRLFRSEQAQEQESNLMVFITATIVDPAGNRIHKGGNTPIIGDMPRMPTGIPPQPSQAIPGYYDDMNPNGNSATITQ